jgi:hypothetical protein
MAGEKVSLAEKRYSSTWHVTLRWQHSPSGCCVLVFVVVGVGGRGLPSIPSFSQPIAITSSLSLTDPQPVPFIQSSSLLFHSIRLLVRETGGGQHYILDFVRTSTFDTFIIITPTL